MCGGGGGGGDGADLDDEDRQFGQSMRAGTFKNANSWLGRWEGDNRSDQDIENDRRQTAALERGDETFEMVQGGRGKTAGYREGIPYQAGGFWDRLNQPPTIGGIAGFATSTLVGGPVGFVAGQGVRSGVNTLLGDRATLGGR